MANQTEHVLIHMPKYEVKQIFIPMFTILIIKTESVRFNTPTINASKDIADIQNHIREV